MMRTLTRPEMEWALASRRKSRDGWLRTALRQKIPLRPIASFFFPTHIEFLDVVNCNGMYTKWLKKNGPIRKFDHRFELYQYIQKTYLNDAPIDYLEFGVFRGESIDRWTKIHGHHESRFFGFDSFEGLPEDWFMKGKKGLFDTHGKIPALADPRCQFVRGLFQETLPTFINEMSNQRRLVIHNDSDLYSSTLFCLTKLDAILASGSIIIFDEFNVADHEFRAFIDYTRSHRRAYSVIGGSGARSVEQMAVIMD